MRHPSSTSALRALGAILVVSAASPRAQDAAPDELRLASLLSDHAVLLRDAPVPVWGRGRPGARVTVRGSWFDGGREAVVDEAGRWRVDAPASPAGGPHGLAVSDGATELAVEDLLFGEVWLASGQSNMEFPLAGSNGAEEAVAASDVPTLRLFHVPRRVSVSPEAECEGAWSASRPETAAGFSAVAYHFGLTLHRELGVPIGLVGSYWGGTPVEAWTSEASLRTRSDYLSYLTRLERARAHPEEEPTLEELQAAWWRGWEERDPGMREGWASAAETPEWRPATVPGDWSELGLGQYDGTVWYRCEVDPPAAWEGRDVVLELGSIDDMDVTWFNGEVVGETRGDGHWQEPRRYAVPGALVRKRNTIVVCAVDSGGYGRFGDEERPALLVPAGGDEEEGLELGGWTYREGASLEQLGAWPRDTWFDAGYPTSLYNGMIAPLVPCALSGAIWYQGEANVRYAARYRTLFPLLIRDWRARFERPELPFYFVQIAPFAYPGDAGHAAELREAQALALELPSTGMAVTMDLGNPVDIHPTEKAEVGRRLALWALAGPYGRKGLETSGPLLEGFAVDGPRMRLAFRHADSGLVADGEDPRCFTIAGEDRVFHPARARIEGRTVLVWSDDVPAPVAVRHAWGAADQPDLRNGEGLPAPSFRTDDWPPVSEP